MEGVQKPWQPSKQTLEARFSVDTSTLATKFGGYHLTLVYIIVSKSCVHWICGLGVMWRFAIGSLREKVKPESQLEGKPCHGLLDDLLATKI